MKKILSVLLAVLMLASLVLTMTACGGDADVEVSLPAALANVTKADVPELSGSAWELSGGMVDGVEMEYDDVNTVLENFGGSMNFIFGEDNKVMLSNGEKALESTYTVTDKVLYMDFNEYKYHAVFTVIEELNIMIVANDTEPNSALYFSSIEG